LPRRISPALRGIARPHALIQAAFKGTTATICYLPPDLSRQSVSENASVHARAFYPFTITLDRAPTCIYITIVRYIHFVWDEVKSRANVSKHGVSFEEARTVFFDESARLMHDPDHSKDEDRFVLLGMSRKPRLLLVCHCYREDDHLIRITSARKATRAEARQYGG
jgi:uncharacterized DUF497 family protein